MQPNADIWPVYSCPCAQQLSKDKTEKDKCV